MSSRERRLVVEYAVEVAGEVALERAGCVAACFAGGDWSRDVVLGRWVVLAAVQDDRVQRAVELAVAAAAEPVAERLSESYRPLRCKLPFTE